MESSLFPFPHLTEDHRRRIIAAGTRQGWLHRPEPLVVALSGGGDSVALLLLLLAVVPASRLVLAHAEHGLRGEPSREDARFVQAVGHRFGLDTEVAFLAVRENRLTGESIEVCARRLRLQFLEETARSRRAPWIATGHHADDLAETVLFNQVRGAGERGCAGFREVRLPYVRPVIDFSREELRGLLRAQGFPWREDASNDSPEYTRNRIRHTVLPLLESTVHPGATRHLAALGREMAERNDREEDEARSLLAWVRRPFPRAERAWRGDVALGLKDHLLARVLRLEARSLGWGTLDRRRTEELISLVRRPSSRWRFQWQEDREIVGGRPLWGWVRRPWGVPLEGMPLPLEGEWRWGPWRCRWEEGAAPGGGTFGEWGLALRFSHPPEGSFLGPLASLDRDVRRDAPVPRWCHPWWPAVEGPGEKRILPWDRGDLFPPPSGGCDRMDRLLSFSLGKESACL